LRDVSDFLISSNTWKGFLKLLSAIGNASKKSKREQLSKKLEKLVQLIETIG